MYLVSKEPPLRLSAPPVQAAAIAGIYADGFFQADPVIQTVDGKIYQYAWIKEQYTWVDGSIPEHKRDMPCKRQNKELIEAVAGGIVDCRGVQPLGEWCPAPYTVFAVAEDGNVWVFRKNKPCGLVAIVLSILLGGIGLVTGVIITAVKAIRGRASKRKMNPAPRG